MTICVCICTRKRPGLLKRSLEGITKQETGGRFTLLIVVADNDSEQSARQVVSEFKATTSIQINYCVEPIQNIALARNRALENAQGDFVAFIDDDEFPEPDWLIRSLRTCQERGVDGVLGPVRPFFEQEPPRWVIRGKFCERPEHETGYRLSWRETRTGNVLFRKQILEDLEEPFRPEFGNGGEDQDLFRRLMECGRRFIWCNEAVVYEVVPAERLQRSYMLKRALLRGQNEKQLLNVRSVSKSLVAVPIYTLLIPFVSFLGQHYLMRYSIRLLDHAGKLMAAIGLRPLGTKYLGG
jgi:succinoglycan biosynthesis protein ExoM